MCKTAIRGISIHLRMNTVCQTHFAAVDDVLLLGQITPTQRKNPSKRCRM